MARMREANGDKKGLSDEVLLDFDESRLAHYDRTKAEQLLREHRTVFRNQLAIARWIDGWMERLEERRSHALNPEFDRGYVNGVREVAAHLRQGDFAPDGVFLRELE